MVNQQLLDFIKSQLLKGIDREIITKELLGSGWTEADIQEGFNLANAKIINLTGNSTPPPSTIDIETFNKGKKITYTIVSSIITIFLATGLIFGDEISSAKDFLIKSIKGSKTEIINQISQKREIKPEINQEIPITSQQEQNQIITENEPTQKNEAINKIEGKSDIVVSSEKLPALAKKGPINCGTEMRCFIAAAKSCSPSFVEETMTFDIFDVYSETNKTKMTLTGYDSTKRCGYISKVISATIDYSSKIKAMSEYETATDEAKKEDLAGVRDLVKSTIGMTTKCSFTTTYLSAILVNWSKKIYNSDDYKPGNCTTTDFTGKVVSMM